MSNETSQWLNTNTLIGFTEKRGKAWHWRSGYDNHYDGAIPAQDVQKRLFDWEPVKVQTSYKTGGDWVPTGEYIYVRSDTKEKICATTDTHNAHGYREWLLENVSEIVGGDIQIGSAGMLKNWAQAWVQIELSETQMAHGVEFRPTLLASTSLDGSLAGTYRPVNTIVVCDNTMAAAHAEGVPVYRLRQTKNRQFNAELAREQVGIQLEAQTRAFTERMDQMLTQEVTEDQFQAFLDKTVPLPPEESKAALTRAENARGTLVGMYHTDPRVSIWKNTVWGVVQLMNTYRTHEAQTKGDRFNSIMSGVLKGSFFEKEEQTLDTLRMVLA